MSPSTSKQTRSEQIRSRRQDQNAPKKALKKQPPMPVKQAPTTRVTTRRTSSGYSNATSSQKQANRRKVYVPLKTPGAEISLPAMPNIQVGWRLASFLIFAVSLFALISLKNMSFFRISQVDLVGATRLPADEVIGKIAISDLSIVDVLPGDIENQVLSAFPEIKSAEVTIGLPAVVSVKVTERIPAVLWDMEDEDEFWIDEAGFSFPMRGEATLPVYVKANNFPPSPLGDSDEELIAATDPIVNSTVAERKPDVDPGFVGAILSLNTMLPEGCTLLYDSEYGLGWQDPRGWLVYFGTNTAHIDQKLAQYAKIIEEIQARNIQPALISLEFLRAPFYRLEN